MIISASRRTDIPNYYFEWFLNRIKDGFLYVRNPYNKKIIKKVSLIYHDVSFIVFWTKNPKPMIDKLHKLKNYNYYFQFTLNPYGKDIEKNLLSKNDEIINTFRLLSQKIGKEKVIWRYDPILITEKYSIDYHIKYFEKLASKLENYTEKCIISFIDIYSKVKRNTEYLNILNINEHDVRTILKCFSNIALAYNIKLETCSEQLDLLKEENIKNTKCIDDELISRILGYDINIKKDKNQRKLCGCIKSQDIGAYNTCFNNCVYCYANYSEAMVERSKLLYNEYSEILCDEIKK